MANTKNSTDELLADLMIRMERLIETSRNEGREDALAEVRSLVGGSAAGSTRGPKRSPTGGSMGSGGKKPTARKPAKKAAKKTKSGKPRKNPWAGLSDKDRLGRINAILKGRGLPLKRKL